MTGEAFGTVFGSQPPRPSIEVQTFECGCVAEYHRSPLPDSSAIFIQYCDTPGCPVEAFAKASGFLEL